MVQSFWAGIEQSRNMGGLSMGYEIIYTLDATYAVCRNCCNNSGGACDYDIAFEAENHGVKISDIVSDEHCEFFESRNVDD